MKKILILSVQHTGTFFTSKCLAMAYKNNNLRVGSIYEQLLKKKQKRFVLKGPTELSDFYPPSEIVKNDFIDKTLMRACNPEELKDIKIIIGHEHFHKPDSWILKALNNMPARCDIVIPVRDPILSLHSKIWREIEQHKNQSGIREKDRKRRLERWISIYKQILTIPKGNAFIFPIDASQSQTETGRIKLIKELYRYCDLDFNEDALEYAESWQPINRTYHLIKKEMNTDPSPQWEDFKSKYLQGNIEHTRAIMGLEFEILHKEKELKKLMKKAGYKDVLWW